MMSHLSELLQTGIDKAEVDREALVRVLGYRNRNKGFRRLDAWLSGSDVPNSPEQVEKLAKALKLDIAQVAKAVQADIEEMKVKASEERRLNPNYRLAIRAVPGFYISRELPGELTVEQALERAREYSNGSARFSLNTPDNKTYWLNAHGDVESITDGQEPFMVAAGKAFRLVVGNGIAALEKVRTIKTE